MTFAHPWGLLALVVPLALCLVELWRSGPVVRLPLDHGDQRPGHWLRRILLASSCLPALLLAIAIVLVCRPQTLEPPRHERKLTNVEFVLDVSGSMMSPFGSGTQYDAAMDAIQTFTGRRRGDAFGLTIFGNEVLRWTLLTKDLTAIRSATLFLRPELLPGNLAAPKSARPCASATKTCWRRGDGDRLIILLTDGASADLGNGAAEANRRRTGCRSHRPVRCVHRQRRPAGGIDRIGAGGRRPGLLDQKPAGPHGHFRSYRPDATSDAQAAARRRIDHFGPLALLGLIVAGVYQATLFGLRYTPW